MMYILMIISLPSFFIFISKRSFLLIGILLEKNLAFLKNYTFFGINGPNYLNSVLISSVN